MPEKKTVAVITSPRLELVPFTLNLLLAAQEGRLETIEKTLKVAIPEGWPHKDVLQHQLPEQIKRLKADPAELPWLGRLMIERDSRMLIGGINVRSATRSSPRFAAMAMRRRPRTHSSTGCSSSTA
jgi:hypothetical protein